MCFDKQENEGREKVEEEAHTLPSRRVDNKRHSMIIWNEISTHFET